MYANANLRAAPEYKLQDKVLVRLHTHSAIKHTTNKFDYKRDGPYIITRQVSTLSYEVSHTVIQKLDKLCETLQAFIGPLSDISNWNYKKRTTTKKMK